MPAKFRRCFLEASAGTPRESGPDVCRTCHFFTLKKTTTATSVYTKLCTKRKRRYRWKTIGEGDLGDVQMVRTCVVSFEGDARVVSLESYVSLESGSLPCTFDDMVCVCPDLSLFSLTRNIINAYCYGTECNYNSDGSLSGQRKANTQLEVYVWLRNGKCY